MERVPPLSEESGNKENSVEQSENRRSGRGPKCNTCFRYAKNCRDNQKRGAEAPGRSKSRLVTSVAEMSDEQLEQKEIRQRATVSAGKC